MTLGVPPAGQYADDRADQAWAGVTRRRIFRRALAVGASFAAPTASACAVFTWGGDAQGGSGRLTSPSVIRVLLDSDSAGVRAGQLLQALENSARAVTESSSGRLAVRIEALPPRTSGPGDVAPASATRVHPGLRAALGGEQQTSGGAGGAGQGPIDLIALSRPDGVIELAADGSIQPVQAFLRTRGGSGGSGGSGGTGSETLGDFSPAALDALRVREQLYGLPVSGVADVLEYDPGRFDAAGLVRPPRLPTGSWRWQEFTDACRRLTYGAAGGRPAQYALLNQGSLDMWIWQAGGEVLSEDGRRCLVAEPEAIEGIRFYHGLLTAGLLPPPLSARQGPADGPMRVAPEGIFLGPSEDSPRGVMEIGPAAAVLRPDWWPLRLAEVPRGRRAATPLRLQSAVVLASASRNRDAAASAMVSLVLEAQRHVSAPVRVPTARQLLESPAGARLDEEQAAVVVAALRDARSLPLALSDALRQAFDAHISLPLRRGERTPEQAARAAQAAIDSLLRA